MLHKYLWVAALGLTMAAAGSVSASVLSGNLIQGGDFEDTSHLKNSGSNDNTDTYIPLHRFNQDADLGKWLGVWGPPSISDGTLAGFSLWDDPRSDPPGSTQQTGDIGSMNRSVDPFRAANHAMETTMFRPRTAQWIAAPENHVPGPISFSFDFYLNRWQPFGGTVSSGAAQTVFQFVLVGTNELPPHDTGYVGNGVAVDPRTAIGNSTLDGVVLANFNWGDWWDWPNTPTVAGNDNGWLTISSGDLTHWNFNQTNDPGVQDGKQDLLITEIEETYAYYAVAIFARVYHEGDPYFWLYSPDAHIIDTPALLWDNIVLQLSVEESSVPDPIPADFSIDALVNTEDINPFILALTNTTAWLNYARPLLPDGLTDQQIIDYADPNGDGSINTEDIAWFICWLTTPGSCGGGGGGAIIPEPASLSLLAAGALALIRRRR